MNGIGDAGVKELGEELKNTQVTTLDLRSNNIGRSAENAIDQIIENNKLKAVNLCTQFKQFVIEEGLIADNSITQDVNLKFNKQASDNLDGYIKFVQYCVENPKSIIHLINDQTIAYTPECIKSFFNTIEIQFGRMIATELPQLTNAEHLYILEKLNDLGLYDTCKELLYHRHNYIDPDGDGYILHEYVYGLMQEYNINTFLALKYQGSNAIDTRQDHLTVEQNSIDPTILAGDYLPNELEAP